MNKETEEAIQEIGKTAKALRETGCAINNTIIVIGVIFIAIFGSFLVYGYFVPQPLPVMQEPQPLQVEIVNAETDEWHTGIVSNCAYCDETQTTCCGKIFEIVNAEIDEISFISFEVTTCDSRGCVQDVYAEYDPHNFTKITYDEIEKRLGGE